MTLTQNNINNTFNCLVIMHNELNERNNTGKTVMAMLSCIPKNNLSLLYLTKTSYAQNECENSLRISEKELLYKFLGIKAYNPFNAKTTKEHSENIKRSFVSNTLSRRACVLALRSYLWANKRWKTKKLDNFISKVRPDIIFVVPGYIGGIIDLALYYSNSLQIPIASFVTDDYFTMPASYNPISFVLNKILNKKYKILSEKAKLHYAIGAEMAEKYYKHFGCKHIAIMNCVDISGIPKNYEINRNCKFVYTGNIGIGRLDELIKLADAIDKINDLYGLNASLDIYSPLALSDAYKNEINKYKALAYKGSVYAAQLKDITLSADVLVHVESFNEKYKHLLKTAISTKIPDYLNSGRQILAIGPSYSASINYINSHKAGCCLYEANNARWHEQIYNMLKNKEMRQKNIDNAYKTVCSFHNKKKRAAEIYNSLAKFIKPL